MKNRPIGIFDSGVGGLTVLRQIQKTLPLEDVVYFGDTARLPYGNKSKATVVKFSIENSRFLTKKNVKMIVVACNTSASFSLEKLRRLFNVPVVGVVEAGSRIALNYSKNKRIGVIGTKSTIASKSYQKQIQKGDKNAKLFSQSCPLFVPLIEEGMLNGPIVSQVIKMYLEKIKLKNIDTLILGCTHYPLLKPEIANYLRGVKIIDSASAVAKYVKVILTEKKLLSGRSKKGKEEFYVSDEPVDFERYARLFLKRIISKPRIVNV